MSEFRVGSQLTSARARSTVSRDKDAIVILSTGNESRVTVGLGFAPQNDSVVES